jgi:hypothetical protein
LRAGEYTGCVFKRTIRRVPKPYDRTTFLTASNSESRTESAPSIEFCLRSSWHSRRRDPQTRRTDRALSTYRSVFVRAGYALGGCDVCRVLVMGPPLVRQAEEQAPCVSVLLPVNCRQRHDAIRAADCVKCERALVVERSLQVPTRGPRSDRRPLTRSRSRHRLSQDGLCSTWRPLSLRDAIRNRW